MTDRLLLVLMSALGIGLALTPGTSKMNPTFFKAATWFFRGIIFQLLK